MTGYWTKAGLGVALMATTLSVAAPAEAQRYRRNRGGGDVATGAIIGGIVGLAAGAAIASSNRDRYYDRGYRYDGYQPRGYYGGPAPRFRGYYAPPRDYYRGYDRGYDRRYYGGYGRGYYGDYPGGYGGGYGAPRYRVYGY